MKIEFVNVGSGVPDCPQVNLVVDGTELVVATSVRDKYLRRESITIEEIKDSLMAVLGGFDRWEVEREASLRGDELYGRRELAVGVG